MWFPLPSPSTDVHTYTHTCAHTHMRSSGWDASSPASLHPCSPASLWFCHRWSDFETEMPLRFAVSSFFYIADFAGNIYCAFCAFCGMNLQEGNACSCEPVFCLNISYFSCLIHYYSMGWAQLSPIPLWLSSPLCLVGCKPEAAPRLFCLCWKTFLFSFALPKQLSAASWNFVWSGFWAMCSVPRLCGRGGHQGPFWPANLRVPVAADHPAPLLQDSTAAALLFCPKKNCPNNFFGEEDEGSNPCPFWILWNQPEKLPCRPKCLWRLMWATGFVPTDSDLQENLCETPRNFFPRSNTLRKWIYFWWSLAIVHIGASFELQLQINKF